MARGPRLDLRSIGTSLRATWRGLRRRWAAALPPMHPDRPRRFAPLQRLEDRCLLSVTPLGTEFRVNTTTANNQQTFAQAPQAVAAAPGGQFIVTWSSQGQDGNGFGVYAQRYNATGPVGGEFQVNATTAGDQQASAVATDAAGDFVLTWQSSQNGSDNIYAQRYDSAGRPQGGEFRVDAGFTQQDQNASVGMDANGNFVIVWQNNGQDGNSWGVFGQRYDSGGNPVGGPFQVNTYTANAQQAPQVTMAADGSFVVAWQSNNQDGNSWGIFGQRYDSSGNRVGGEFQVNTTTAGSQQDPAVAIAPNHNFVVTWDGNQGGDWNIYAQRYDASGAPVGGEFRVNTFTPNEQRYPSVAADGLGNFEITWSSLGQDGSGWGVYAQRYNADGSPDGAEFHVSTYTPGDQEWSSIAAPAQTTSAPGNLEVVWTSNNQDGSGLGVYGQQFAVTGITVSPTSITTTKAGGTATFSVVLDSKPAADVTLPLVSSDPTEGAVSTPTLTFTPSTWNVPQTVTVTGQNDFLAGNASYTILTGPAISTDLAYNGIDPADVSATNVNPTAAGVTVSPTSGLATSGAGGSAGFTVVLNAQPTANVVIPVSSSNTSAGTVSTSSLLFTPSNWNVAQTVTVTGVDDHVVDGDTAYKVLLGPAQSTDPSYSGIDPPDVSVTNQETDVAGVVVTPTSGLVTTELGGTAPFTVQLSSEPTAPVTIAVSSSDTTQGTPSVSSLTFDATDWSAPQTVTVTGHDDHIVNGDQPYTINLAAASSPDPVYDGNFATPVSLANREEDVAGIGVTGDSFLITEDNKLLRVNATTGATATTFATGTVNGSVAVGPDGSMYLADSNHNQVVQYDPTGARVVRFGSGQLTFPEGLAFGPDGNLYVASGDNSVQEFSAGGAFLGTFITAGSGGLSNPRGITWGPDGNVYVSSYNNSEVLRYNGTTGAFLNVFATGTGGFEDLTFGPDRNLYVASYGDNAVYRFRGSDGAALGAFVSGGPLATPLGLRFDPAGNLDVSSQSLGTIQTYNGTTGAFVGNLVTGLTNPSYLVSPTSLVTSETGTTAQFHLVLDSQPASDVTITLNSTMPGQGKLSTSSLTFTAANWNVAQTVTVTGLDDGVVNGDQVYQINGTAASSDPHYNGLAISPVVVVNREADAATSTTVSSSANPSVYGQAVTFTATVSASGQGTPTGNVTFFDGTTALGSASLSGGAATLTTSALVAGSHQITAQYGGAPLFAVSTSAVLTEAVNPAPLTVTANDAGRVYGQPNPAITASYSGFVNGDTAASLSGTPSLSTTATAGSHAGTYSITAGPGTLNDPNYTFTFVSGTLTVTPAALTVTAKDAAKVYGAALPAFYASYSGFVNGDSAASLAGAPSLATTATAASHVGTYAIIAGPGTLRDPDYTFTFVSGKLTITPAALTVTDNQSTVYGSPLPTLTPSYSGFVNGDAAASLSGAPSLSTAASAGSHVGSYVITTGPGTLGDADYAFTFANGTLTVTPAPLTVTADDATRVYGQANPKFAASYNGLVNGDTTAALGGTLTLTTPAAVSSPAGSYPIIPGGLTSGDYAIRFVNGTLVVTPVTGPGNGPGGTPTPTRITPVEPPVVPPEPTPGGGEPTPPVAATPPPAPPPAPAIPLSLPADPVAHGTAPAAPADARPTPSVARADGSLAAAQPAQQAAVGAEFVRTSGGSSPTATGTPAATPLFAPLIQQAVFFVSPRSKVLDGAGGAIAAGVPTVADPPPLPGAAPPEVAAAPPPDGRPDLLLQFPWQEPAQVRRDVELLGLPPQATALVGTGVLATTGYLLLNTRTGVWLLSLLASQPLWKELDPLEVLYAWEQEEGREDEGGETLLSLVE